MKKGILIFLALAGGLGLLSAQEGPRFTVELSSDSILLGNYFKAVFTLENANGQAFDPPHFEGFEIVSGPNVASSFSMTNGRTSQRVSYTYYLRPRNIGNYYIEPASIAVGETVLETLPVPVTVVPNPEGIIQEPREERSHSFDWGWDEDWPSFQPFRERLRPQLPELMPELMPEPEPQEPPKPKRKTYKL
jgi:hypothetical protein